MTRTTIAALAVGGALTLAACSSHSSPPSAGSGTSAPLATVVPTGPAASSSTPPATAPATLAATSAAVPTTPAAVATSSAPSVAATPSIPVTVTSPGSKPTVTTKPATPATPTTSVSPTPGGQCLNAQLALSLKAGSPGAGQIYTSIVFTNTSTVPCTLSGHPGVSYVAGSDGHQVGTSASRDAGTVTTVTLAANGTASATLHEANYQNFDAAVCKPVQTEGLRVYPPGSNRSFFVRRLGMQCSATVLPAPALSIGVVKAGSGD